MSSWKQVILSSFDGSKPLSRQGLRKIIAPDRYTDLGKFNKAINSLLKEGKLVPAYRKTQADIRRGIDKKYYLYKNANNVIPIEDSDLRRQFFNANVGSSVWTGKLRRPRKDSLMVKKIEEKLNEVRPGAKLDYDKWARGAYSGGVEVQFFTQQLGGGEKTWPRYFFGKIVGKVPVLKKKVWKHKGVGEDPNLGYSERMKQRRRICRQDGKVYDTKTKKCRKSRRGKKSKKNNA